MTLSPDVEAGTCKPAGRGTGNIITQMATMLPRNVLYGQVEPLLTPESMEAVRRVLREHIALHELFRVAIRKILEVPTRDVRRLELTRLLGDVEEISH